MNTKPLLVKTMSLTELIDVQCEIIKMQSKLIKNMAIEIGQENIFAEEMSHINALKERIEAQSQLPPLIEVATCKSELHR